MENPYQEAARLSAQTDRYYRLRERSDQLRLIELSRAKPVDSDESRVTRPRLFIEFVAGSLIVVVPAVYLLLEIFN